MKKFIYLLPFIALTIFSCGDDDAVGDLELNFVATYDGQPVATDGTFYDYQNDQKIQFENIRFFIAEIELENNDGSSTSLSEVELINLSGKDAVTAAEGESVSFEEIKGGDYKSITFHIGLSERLNNLKPADIEATSPLQDGTYWSGWGSFIFSTVEGKADLDNDGIAEHNMVYHIGGNQSVRPKTFAGEVEIKNNKTTTLNFEIDLKDMFMGNGQPFDIEKFSAIHTETDVMEDLADRMTEAFNRN